MSDTAAIPDLPDDWQKAGLFYRAENGIDFFNLAIPPEDTITDPRERESCRAFLVRALALLDAGPVRLGGEAVVAYRWDTNHGGRRTSNIWCPDCNTEFQQCGTADADLTARDVTPGQTCDVCGKDILTDPKTSKEPTP